MPLGYRLIRALSRLLLRLFYRRVEVVGGDRIPPCGPLLVLANHQNALVDGMLLLAVIPRRLRPPEPPPAPPEHGGEIPRIIALPCERDRLLSESH